MKEQSSLSLKLPPRNAIVVVLLFCCLLIVVTLIFRGGIEAIVSSSFSEIPSLSAEIAESPSLPQQTLEEAMPSATLDLNEEEEFMDSIIFFNLAIMMAVSLLSKII